MSFLYGLKYRPATPGAFPEGATPTSARQYCGIADVLGMVETDTCLERDVVGKYELTEFPLLEYEWYWRYPPEKYGDMLDMGRVCTLNLLKNLMFDFTQYLKEMNDYHFPYVSEPGSRLPNFPRGDFWERRTKLVSGRNVAALLEFVPEWATHMIQYALDGCPLLVFSNLTPEGIIDKCIEIDDNDAYELFVD